MTLILEWAKVHNVVTLFEPTSGAKSMKVLKSPSNLRPFYATPNFSELMSMSKYLKNETTLDTNE
ncbi:hypothetical protein HK096_000499, partial [Nowakowskiella sp. JEL0078]